VLQHVHGVGDRRERVAQLVREHREELVLALVRLLDLAVEQRVLERGRRARGREVGRRAHASVVELARAGHREPSTAIGRPRAASGSAATACAIWPSGST
jgi:hypothetical protein